MKINQSKAIITLKIRNQEDLDHISSMKLKLRLSQAQQEKKHNRVYQTEPLVVCELPVTVHQVIPVKEATAKINLITVRLVQ